MKKNTKMLRPWILCLTGAIGLGCDAFQAHEDVVARAGGVELSVDRLAGIIAAAPDVPIEQRVVDLLARRWVEFSAFSQRAADGDSLLDSALAVQALWYNVHRAIVDSFHVLLTHGKVEPTPSQVDSAYRAGDLRFIAHILRRLNAQSRPEERERQRAIAERIHDDLIAGGDWSKANELNEDSVAKRRNGALGVLRRGVATPRFENAAYELSPGGVSPVTETEFGFHVIWRPPLDDVRNEFGVAVRAAFTERLDSIYEDELIARRRMQIRPSAAAAIREAYRAPLQAKTSDQVLASYDGGTLTVAEFIKWIEVLPPQMVARIETATDAQLAQLTRSLVVQELIFAEADSAGVKLSAEQFKEIDATYRGILRDLQNVMGIHPDTLAARASTRERRFDLARVVVDIYMEEAVKNPRLLVPVPTALADHILEDTDWVVRPGGVRQVVERARAMRAAQPTTGETR